MSLDSIYSINYDLILNKLFLVCGVFQDVFVFTFRETQEPRSGVGSANH